MPLQQAIQLARERDFDLVAVADNASPVVCRLLDYGKYKYQQSKKERDARKGQKTTVTREVRVSPRIGGHDLDAKIRLIRRLLDEGDKVRVTLMFKGREITHPERGREVFRKILDQLKEEALVEPLMMEERKLKLTLSSRKQVTKPTKESV